MKIRAFIIRATALSVVALLSGAPAWAQGLSLPASPKCQGSIFVDSVYQQGLGGNRYDYYFQIRNQTANPMNWSVNIGGFSDATVTIDQENRSGRLNGNSSTTVKFGSGTDGNINTRTVAVMYDAPAAIGNPYINVRGCF